MDLIVGIRQIEVPVNDLVVRSTTVAYFLRSLPHVREADGLIFRLLLPFVGTTPHGTLFEKVIMPVQLPTRAQ